MMRTLFDKYKCDKGHRHGYEAVYEADFEKVKDEPINIFEIGILRGESIKVWLDYFPNGTVYAVDNFSRIPPEKVEILSHERVKWVSGDSTSNSLRDTIDKEWSGVKFDIIIDDGLHTPRANMLSFMNLSKYLKKGGIYYIEDVFPMDIMTTKELSIPFLTSKPDAFNMLEYNKFLNAINSYKPERIDLRKNSGNPDSHIIKVTK